MRNTRSAFTLIELLIVIAIIAILALIAVPNFLEAQVRAKVARVQADMRSATTAIEAYTVDWGRQPIGNKEGSVRDFDDMGKSQADNITRAWLTWARMTTPVAYITTPPQDPFMKVNTDFVGRKFVVIFYQSIVGGDLISDTPGNSYNVAASYGYMWVLQSPGPGRNTTGPAPVTALAQGLADGFYDPSNGTISEGHIIRTNKGAGFALKH